MQEPDNRNQNVTLKGIWIGSWTRKMCGKADEIQIRSVDWFTVLCCQSPALSIFVPWLIRHEHQGKLDEGYMRSLYCFGNLPISLKLFQNLNGF